MDIIRSYFRQRLAREWIAEISLSIFIAGAIVYGIYSQLV